MSEPQRLISVDEFAAMRHAGDWKEELFDGQIERSPLPSAEHGVTCANAARLLEDYRSRGNRPLVSVGSGLIVARDPDSVFAPDISVWSPDRQPAVLDDWPSIPPRVVIEIAHGVSAYKGALKKVLYYLAFGVDQVWLVWVNRRAIEVHKLAEQQKPFDPWEWRYVGYGRSTHLLEADDLDGGDVLPGFSCKVADFFA